MNVLGIGSYCLILMDYVMTGIVGISGYWFRVRNWFPNVQHRGIGCILPVQYNVQSSKIVKRNRIHRYKQF